MVSGLSRRDASNLLATELLVQMQIDFESIASNASGALGQIS